MKDFLRAAFDFLHIPIAILVGLFAMPPSIYFFRMWMEYWK